MVDTYESNPAAPAVRGPALTARLSSVWQALIPAGLALLALVLRWDRLQYAHFSGDQAWALGRAFDFVHHGVIPLTGMRTSVGSSHGPMEIYLLALPSVLSSDPLVATAFVGLLQTLAVTGTYLFASRYFGRWAGLAAGLLYAVNPWALNYARRIWSPDFVPLFCLLFFAALCAAVVERRRYFFSLACALLAVLFLLHPATVALWPVLGLALLLFWRRLGPRPLLLGLALGLLVASPYLYGDYLQGWPSLSTYASLPGKASGFDFSAFSLAITLATSRFFPAGLGDSFRGEWRLPEPGAQNVATEWLVYLGIAVCVWRLATALRARDARPGERWEPYLLLLLWLFLPVLATSRNSAGYQPVYFLFFYPAQFLLAGIAIATGLDLSRRATPRLRAGARWPLAVVAAALVAWLALPQAQFFRAYLDLMESNGPQGSFGIPLIHSRQAVANARDALAETGGATVFYFGSGAQSEALRYLARPEVEVRRLEPDAMLPLPADTARGAVVLVGPENEAARQAQEAPADDPAIRQLSLLGYAEDPGQAVRGPDGHVYFRLFRPAPVPGALPNGFRPWEGDATLQGGMRLLGYKVPAAAEPGETVTLVLLWEMPEGLGNLRGTEREYVVFAHLTDGAGKVAGNAEADIFAGRSWRDGERLATFHEYTLPATETPRLLWFDLGAYTRLAREDLAWRDPSGAAAPVLRVGPLKVEPATIARPATETPYQFGEALRLAGFGLTPQRPGAGETLTVHLHWQATARPAADYTISVQLLDEGGRLVAQHDAQPASGAYPTSYWDRGEAIVDSHPLSLPADLAPGRYALSVVVYSSAGGTRLPLTAPAATPSERALLVELQIAAE